MFLIVSRAVQLIFFPDAHNMKDAFICLFSSKEAKLLKQLAKFITASMMITDTDNDQLNY